MIATEQDIIRPLREAGDVLREAMERSEAIERRDPYGRKPRPTLTVIESPGRVRTSKRRAKLRAVDDA